MNQFFVFFAACLKDETESVNQQHGLLNKQDLAFQKESKSVSNAVNQQYISQHLSDGDADDRNNDVGSRQSQNDGDGTS